MLKDAIKDFSAAYKPLKEKYNLISEMSWEEKRTRIRIWKVTEGQKSILVDVVDEDPETCHRKATEQIVWYDRIMNK